VREKEVAAVQFFRRKYRIILLALVTFIALC